MNREEVNSHILLIYDQPEPRQVLLKSATYSIGRDKHNSIVIQDRAISRQHALLLRMPLPTHHGYRYRIIDGNASGQPSLNGISVNGVECKTHDLNPNDVIVLGGMIQIKYQVLNVPASGKYFDYLNIQAANFHSIKTKPVNPSSTLVNLEDLDLSSLQEDSDILTLDEFEDDFFPTELFNGRP